MAKQQETRLQQKIKSAIKTKYPKAYVFKVHGGQFSQGVPDLVACIKGKFFAFEVKVPGRERTVSELQQVNLDQITAAKGQAHVVTSSEQVIEILDAFFS